MTEAFSDSLHSVPPHVLMGIFSGVLSLFAFFPYVADTLARRTEPHRASWFIWTVLSLIAFFSQVYEGATSSLWFAGVQTFFTSFIFLISIRFGFGSYLSRNDWLILATASFGLILWYFTDTAAYALAISIGVSLIGGIATILKAYKRPESETLQMWSMSLVASIFAIGSVATFDIILLAYPLYLLVLNAGILMAILFGRLTRGTPQVSFNHHLARYPSGRSSRAAHKT